MAIVLVPLMHVFRIGAIWLLNSLHVDTLFDPSGRGASTLSSHFVRMNSSGLSDLKAWLFAVALLCTLTTRKYAENGGVSHACLDSLSAKGPSSSLSGPPCPWKYPVFPHPSKTTTGFLVCHPPEGKHSEARIQASLVHAIRQVFDKYLWKNLMGPQTLMGVGKLILILKKSQTDFKSCF